jgi:hypothetical protein
MKETRASDLSLLVRVQDAEDRVQVAAEAFRHFTRSYSPMLEPATTCPKPLETSDGIALVIEHPLDLHDGFDVPSYIQPLASSALFGLEKAELRFPKAKNIRRQVCDMADLSDLVVNLAA